MEMWSLLMQLKLDAVYYFITADSWVRLTVN